MQKWDTKYYKQANNFLMTTFHKIFGQGNNFKLFIVKNEWPTKKNQYTAFSLFFYVRCIPNAVYRYVLELIEHYLSLLNFWFHYYLKSSLICCWPSSTFQWANCIIRQTSFFHGMEFVMLVRKWKCISWLTYMTTLQ